MARIPYSDVDRGEARPVAQRVVAERGSLLHLYRMLLHSPPLADGWLSYLTAVRQKLELPGAIRELVIMRVAALNGASYEADQHAPIALREGVLQAQLDTLEDWERSEGFPPAWQAALALTDAMTRDVQVSDSVFNAAHAHFGERQLVELVGIIAAYNMVSRFLEALQIHSHDEPAAGRRP